MNGIAARAVCALVGVVALGSVATATERDHRGPRIALEDMPTACWAEAADGSYDDFEASVELYESCTAADYSFSVVNPALGAITCFREDGFCPLFDPNKSRAAVRLSGFAAGAARGETASRHQVSNVIVRSRGARRAVLTFRTTAFYFNEDGSFELGWGDHQLVLVKRRGRWKIQREDVFIPAPNQRLGGQPHGL